MGTAPPLNLWSLKRPESEVREGEAVNILESGLL